MNIYDLICERFKGLDNLLENGYLAEEEHFNYCTKLTDVMLELSKHGAVDEVPPDQFESETIRLADTETEVGNE